MKITVREATKQMFIRYKSINNDFNVLCNPPKNEIEGLIQEGIDRAYELPVDKLNRWLGYVQHYLISNGLLSINGERDFSRPLYHEAYLNEGLEIPTTIEIKA